MSKDDKGQKRNGKVSLHPLGFEDALRGLLQTKPPEKPVKEEESENVKHEPLYFESDADPWEKD